MPGCACRCGIVIEMRSEAFWTCLNAADEIATREHFRTAFMNIYGVPDGYSPFTLPDYRESYEPEQLMASHDRRSRTGLQLYWKLARLMRASPRQNASPDLQAYALDAPAYTVPSVPKIRNIMSYM